MINCPGKIYLLFRDTLCHLKLVLNKNKQTGNIKLCSDIIF